MKRKRWLAMALVFCLLGTTVPLTALAAGEDGEVQYIVSNDGTTLTIQGDGEITSQALDANVTAEQKKTLTSVEIGAGVTGIADGYSSVFPAGVTNVTLKGSGAFRFGKYSFKGQKNLTVQSERTSLAIGSYAFHNAVLTEFPMDQLHTIGSYGFSNAVLPLEGETLTLQVEVPASVAAPVVPGQVLGRAVLCLDGREVASADLVALTPAPMYVEPEEDKGFFARLFGG